MDEPQFNTRDGSIGFMLHFFRRLRDPGRLVVLYLHPTAPYHIDIVLAVIRGYPVVPDGRVSQHPDFASRLGSEGARSYLRRLAERVAA